MYGSNVTKESSVRRQVKHHLLYFNMVFFVDEVSLNTGIKNDGNKGEQNFVVERGKFSRQCDSTPNTCWTALPFLNALWEPVMSGIFFASEKMSGFDNITVDIFSEMVEGTAGYNMIENFRKGNGIQVSKITNMRGKGSRPSSQSLQMEAPHTKY